MLIIDCLQVCDKVKDGDIRSSRDRGSGFWASSDRRQPESRVATTAVAGRYNDAKALQHHATLLEARFRVRDVMCLIIIGYVNANRKSPPQCNATNRKIGDFPQPLSLLWKLKSRYRDGILKDCQAMRGANWVTVVR